MNRQGLLSPRGAGGQLQNEIDAHDLVFVVCVPHLRKEDGPKMELRKAADLLDDEKYAFGKKFGVKR